MKKLLSLKKFQKENQDALLEKEFLETVNGGSGDGHSPRSLSHEDKPTLDSWNCCDVDRRMTWDGKPCSDWFEICNESSNPYCC